MPRQRFVWVDDRGLVEVPTDYTPRPRVHIIGDQSRPFRSHADGRIYDSKSAYRRELKARGFEEVGNEYAAVTAPREYQPQDWGTALCETAAEMGVGDISEIKVGDVVDA
jgi:hypothetical protein